MNHLVAIDEEKVLEIAADGATLAEICKKVGIKPIQLYAYCKRYPIFSQRLKEARETGFLTRAEALPDIIVNGIDLGTFQDSKHLRVYVDTEKWLLSKLHASTFGDKQTGSDLGAGPGAPPVPWDSDYKPYAHSLQRKCPLVDSTYISNAQF